MLDLPAAPTNSPLQPSSASRRRRLLIRMSAVVIVLLILGLGGFFTASALEEHDSFCISCHTVPETTYYNRAYIALDSPDQPIYDLATAHYLLSQQHNKGNFTCINCHRGDSSIGHRVSTLALGGRDAVIYVLGKEDPTVEKTSTREGWLPNAACTNCHADTLLQLAGLGNHFHNHLPQAAVALAQGGKLTVPDSLKDREAILLANGLKTVNTPLLCTDCHAAHATISSGSTAFYMDADQRNKACVSCHQAAQEGPQDAKGLP